MCATWLIHMCDMTPSCMWHDSCICATRGWKRKKRRKAKIRCLNRNHDFADRIRRNRCSTLLKYNRYLSADDGPRFCSVLYLISTFFVLQLFLVSGYFGVENSSFLMKGIFFFLKGTNLVPMGIELVPGLGPLPSPLCDMTHSYVRHDSFICATWLILMCDMTHSYERHDSCICTTWLMQMCDYTLLGEKSVLYVDIL